MTQETGIGHCNRLDLMNYSVYQNTSMCLGKAGSDSKKKGKGLLGEIVAGWGKIREQRD